MVFQPAQLMARADSQASVGHATAMWQQEARGLGKESNGVGVARDFSFLAYSASAWPDWQETVVLHQNWAAIKCKFIRRKVGSLQR